MPLHPSIGRLVLGRARRTKPVKPFPQMPKDATGWMPKRAKVAFDEAWELQDKWRKSLESGGDTTVLGGGGTGGGTPGTPALPGAPGVDGEDGEPGQDGDDGQNGVGLTDDLVRNITTNRLHYVYFGQNPDGITEVQLYPDEGIAPADIIPGYRHSDGYSYTHVNQDDPTKFHVLRARKNPDNEHEFYVDEEAGIPCPDLKIPLQVEDEGTFTIKFLRARNNADDIPEPFLDAR